MNAKSLLILIKLSSIIVELVVHNLEEHALLELQHKSIRIEFDILSGLRARAYVVVLKKVHQPQLGLQQADSTADAVVGA